MNGTCLSCDLIAGVRPLPGGIVTETKRWVVNHCLGPLGLGTLVAVPKRHVVRVAELNDEEASELGPLLKRVASILTALTTPEQVYVCLWSHGRSEEKHLHWIIQPVITETVQRHGGRRSEALQAAMFEAGEYPENSAIEEFCAQARLTFETN
jgi:diadenosine tetraphosphate (Ap4A) HIT family hydrolase